MNRSILVLLAAGAATLAVSGAALASSNSEARSVRVSYADLDLAKAPDAARLYGRLRDAANAVCDLGDRRDVQVAAAHHACFDKALGEAVAAVGNANVTARYVGTATGALRRTAS